MGRKETGDNPSFSPLHKASGAHILFSFLPVLKCPEKDPGWPYWVHYPPSQWEESWRWVPGAVGRAARWLRDTAGSDFTLSTLPAVFAQGPARPIVLRGDSSYLVRLSCIMCFFCADMGLTVTLFSANCLLG